ncbi:hypothetical protein BN946_scf184911.g94 [Trametes cinnabarina]|uniref:Uncharacterized protein n=1 Tax=Pycnoporus cinnabarinus TaxID=5643 RepID=A0A060SHA2_PYCCI|nr:hypothetical protein BN946_scf184911.g94 [Trametes cinnabarina]
MDAEPDAPRVVQWVDEDTLEDLSDEESINGSDDEEEEVEEVDHDRLEADLKALPFGALRKAQKALAKVQADDSEEEASDYASESEAEFGSNSESVRDKGKAREEPRPKKEVPKRKHKHAPTEMSSKRPVPRMKLATEPKPAPRDPRFLPITGEFDPKRFHTQYGFLAELHEQELKTLKENLKRARKLLANSPRDLREEREAEVQRLERAVKRAESLVNKDRQEKVQLEALSKVAKEEREKRQQGKKAWYMKDADKKALLLRAKYEALASEGGRGAVRKAIEKKQKKVSQKEKKRRPQVGGPPPRMNREAGPSRKPRRNNDVLASMPHQDEPGSYFQLPPPAELYGYVHNPVNLTDGSDSEGEDHDIYRGRPPTPTRTASPAPSSQTSSSSSSSVFGGRLGAISAGVEHAISRWARAWTSSTTLSSSTSSSASVISLTKSQTTRRRKRRPRSLATVHNARSEREVAARIRAREDLRTIPRGFVLYTPTPAIQVDKAPHERSRRQQPAREPVFRTTSLQEVTTRLSAVLKERAKARRPRTEPASPIPSRPLSPHHDYMLSDESDVARPSPGLPPRSSAQAKGKQRASMARSVQSLPAASTIKSQLPGSFASRVPKAWWLDVSSPTWEDMCAIGKLLHLHPLTLEDILTQDPREKLELFPKLGYYFISFRAIESQKTRERLRNLLSTDDEDPRFTDEGVVGEVNVYLIIFREGICSFHFADIAEHVDRVRTRIMLLGESINTSSDWIAHGIMDSIVDSFFPFLEVIEREVLEIENIVFTDNGPNPPVKESVSASQSGSSATDTALTSERHGSIVEPDEKHSIDHITSDYMQTISPKPRFSSPMNIPLLFRRARRAFSEIIGSIPRFKAIDTHAADGNQPSTIHRIARTRRLVTSLSRYLAVKSEVVTQVKKRLLIQGEWGLGTGTEDDLDVFVYMGDVQDHIITLQQALAHYERMLNQSHPAYLSQLRLLGSKSKSSSDKAIVSLTAISMGVLFMQTLLGLMSMNCEVPHDPDGSHRYDVFATVIAIAVFIITVYGFVVRRWWLQAKRRRLQML